jgi:uncharacterized phage-associated protein
VTQDVRGIANFVLEVADTEQRYVSNLSINKIIYFLHVAFLHNFNQPLVSAKIEAWDHGPVFREVYHQFKKFGRESIRTKAQKIDIASGTYIEATYDLTDGEAIFLKKRCIELLGISAGKLVDMTHVKDGPWYTARFGNGRVNPGVEITNELILEAGAEQSRH